MMRKEKKWMEVSKRSEATLNDDTCACNMGWMRTWTNAVCDHVNKEKQSRDADTNNKEERPKTNKLSCGSIHSAHESLVDVFVSLHMLQFIPHVVGLVALWAEFTCCQCTKLIHFLTCSRIPCRDSHCGNGLVKCFLYTPHRLQQTTVSWKDLTATKQNLESRHVWGFVERRQTTGPPVLSCRFARKLAHSWTFFWICHELHLEIAPLPPVGGRTRWLVAIVDISRMALTWVVVLQILGVDGLMWSSHRWSQNDLSSVRFFQNY